MLVRGVTLIAVLIAVSTTTACFVTDLFGPEEVVVGDYELVSVNDQDIPALVSDVQYLGGSLGMRESGSFRQVLLLQLGEIGVTTTITGSYTVDGSTVAFQIASAKVNGDDVVLNTTSISGTWSGDEIRIADEQLALVFKK